MRKLKGSLTVEAALVLPIFVFAIISIIYFIKIVYIQESIQYAITETANEIATYAYILDNGEIIDAQQDIHNAIGKESLNSIAAVGLGYLNNAIGIGIVNNMMDKHISKEDYQHWHIVGGKSGMDYSKSSFMLENEDIEIIVSYKLKIPLPVPVSNIEEIPMLQRVVVRTWTGNGNFNSRITGNKETKGQVVYITRTGKRYHTNEYCTYLKIKTKKVLYKAIKNTKSPCKICAKGVKMNDHDSVLISTYGYSYHIDEHCWEIEKETVQMDIREAIQKGYTICSKCNKGN